jgi:uncharacterized membrane protein YcaP (DUF421 family)
MEFIALLTVLRAVFGYLFLVLVVRIVGRRPGKQLTPFEFVLIFYLGGLTLTGMVGPEASIFSAVCQILTVALCHYGLSSLRFRSQSLARLLDGVPLILMEKNGWRHEALRGMMIKDDDVMAVAREQGIRDLSGIRMAVLETYGQINVVPASPKEQQKDS